MITVIVPTKDRCKLLQELLHSLEKLRGLSRIQPEIIVGDNNSTDSTWEMLQQLRAVFPTELKMLRVTTPGKSVVLNESIRRATGDILAFLDDDVVVDEYWLEELETFFSKSGPMSIGQGIIRIAAEQFQDAETRRLLERYRTIPQLEFRSDIGDLHSLNGANIAIRRNVFDQIGYFDERLGPGASGTSEDVEIAQRMIRAGMRIGYMERVTVYHAINRDRLTDGYFKQSHWRQGASRFLMRKRSSPEIILNLFRAYSQYGYYSLVGKERDLYRSKGRIYHYLGMMDAKRKQLARPPIKVGETRKATY